MSAVVNAGIPGGRFRISVSSYVPSYPPVVNFSTQVVPRPRQRITIQSEVYSQK